MPIYAYRCSACGHQKDVLQKLADAPLSTCPACGAETFSKQVTAAGFQLKGSGWYVTDFRNGSGGKAPAAAPAAGGDGAPAAATSEGASSTPAASGGAPAPAASGGSSAGGDAAPGGSKTPAAS